MLARNVYEYMQHVAYAITTSSSLLCVMIIAHVSPETQLIMSPS